MMIDNYSKNLQSDEGILQYKLMLIEAGYPIHLSIEELEKSGLDKLAELIHEDEDPDEWLLSTFDNEILDEKNEP